MDKKIQSFTIPLPQGANDWIKINSGSQALVRVAHSPEMANRLSTSLSNRTVSAVDRAGLLLDAYALAKAGKGPVETVIDILKALTNEDSEIVWSAIGGVLSGLYNLIEDLGGDIFYHFKEFGRKIVSTGLLLVGWDSKASDGHSEKLMRATIISLLDTFSCDDAEVVKEARRRYDLHWTEPEALPSEYKSTVYKIILMNGGIKEYEQILKTFYDTEDNAEKRFSYTLGAIADKKLKTRVLDWCVKSGDVKMQDFFYPIAGVSSSAEGVIISWNYFKDNFEYIKNKLSKASPSLMDAVIVYSISKFCTNERATEIEDFFINNPLPQSARRISQTIESMRANALLKDRYLSN